MKHVRNRLTHNKKEEKDVKLSASERYHNLDDDGKMRYMLLRNVMQTILDMEKNVKAEQFKPLVSVMQAIEFEMQKVLGFDPDARYHRYQFNLAKCTCPRMDNMDMWGTGRWIASEDCPYHVSCGGW